jgi:TolB-like protein
VSDTSHAVFISYASQDAEVAGRICESLRAAGIEVWFDRSELRGGDAWDASIRRQIKSCALFIPIVSHNTHVRDEGYFRLEWKLAVDRSHLMTASRPFLVPVVIDDTSDQDEQVPDRFRDVQWTRLAGGRDAEGFVERVRRLLSPDAATPTATSVGASAPPTASTGTALTRSMPPASRSFAPWIVGGLVILATGYFLADKFLVSKHAVPTMAAPAITAMAVAGDKSVAVLPFVDMSQKKDQEYFADGLSEELIDQLAHTPDLKVIARTSSFQFKGMNQDMRTIGQRLGVANLLEGSVRTSGKTVRVTAQLIKVSDGSHLWSESYDRDMQDIFKVQDAIAAAVVTALQATLATPSARERSVNTEAYKALLRARYFNGMGTKEDTERAIAAYRGAIRLDPTYALAFAELAATYDALGIGGWMPIKEAYTEARAAVDRSLQIAPNLARAHRVLGWIERDYKYDFVTARAERKRADELDPTDPLVGNDAALWAAITGHLDESIRLSRQLVDRNPLDAGAWYGLWASLIRANRLVDAEAAARTLLELNPRSSGVHCAVALPLLYQHKLDAALAMAREETGEGARFYCLWDVLWALGRREEADALLAETETKAKHGESRAFGIAGRYAIRNDKDEAFLWLDRAYENREPGVIFIRTDEAFPNLYGDPRWTAFLRKVKLPE